MTILEKIKFEEDWLSEVNLTKANIKIAFAGIRATALEQQQVLCTDAVDKIITQIERIRDNDKLCEYPYNRCIEVIKKYMAESEG